MLYSEYLLLIKNNKLPYTYIDRYKEMGINCSLNKNFKPITSPSQKTEILTVGCIKSMKDFNKYSHETKWTTLQKRHFDLKKFNFYLPLNLSTTPDPGRNENAVDQLSIGYKAYLNSDAETYTRIFCNIKLGFFNTCKAIFMFSACVLILTHGIYLSGCDKVKYDKTKYFYDSKNATSTAEYSSKKVCNCKHNFKCNKAFKAPFPWESYLYLLFILSFGTYCMVLIHKIYLSRHGHFMPYKASMEFREKPKPALYYKLPKKKPGDLWTAEHCTNCGDSYWLEAAPQEKKATPQEKKPGCLSRLCNKLGNYLRKALCIRSIKPVEIEVPVLDLSVRNNDIMQDGEGIEEITYS